MRAHAPKHPPKGTMHLPHGDRSHIFEQYHSSSGMLSSLLEKARSKKEMLTPIESAILLKHGNRSHAERMSQFGGKPPAEIKSLLLVCSDARLGGMLEFDDFARHGVFTVYIAGNGAAILESPAMQHMLSRMGNDSSIIVMGHAKCGAVKCAGSDETTGSDNISNLISSIHPSGGRINAAEQAYELSTSRLFKSLSSEKKVRVLSAFVDIEHPSHTISIAGDATDGDKQLIARLNKHFSRNNSQQDLSKKQYAHAVAITDPMLGFDAREIFGCKANEIFTVSAGKASKAGSNGAGELTTGSAEMAILGLLEESAVGSVEYSVTHNSSQHIMLLHTDLATVEGWEAELLAKSKIIRDALLRGDIEITSAVYDPATGHVDFKRHLVNENAALSIGTAEY